MYGWDNEYCNYLLTKCSVHSLLCCCLPLTCFWREWAASLRQTASKTTFWWCKRTTKGSVMKTRGTCAWTASKPLWQNRWPRATRMRPPHHRSTFWRLCSRLICTACQKRCNGYQFPLLKPKFGSVLIMPNNFSGASLPPSVRHPGADKILARPFGPFLSRKFTTKSNRTASRFVWLYVSQWKTKS